VGWREPPLYFLASTLVFLLRKYFFRKQKMTTQIVTPLRTIFLLVLAAFLVWWVSGTSDKKIVEAQKVDVTVKSISSVSAIIIEAPSQPVNDGVYLSRDKTRVSVRFTQIPRLVIIQHIAEVAGFDFSLPDNAIEHWQESLTINIDNEPVQDVLAKVIGVKDFNIDVTYDTAMATHKISALYLGGSVSMQAAPPSPVGQHEPLPFERDTSSAPSPEMSRVNENRTKRDNFFTSDEPTRIALLNEMSPVGEDLNFIVTSLRKDEQVAVRIAAAQRLSFSENYVATQSLLDALSDKDDAVVKAAINALVSLGDSSVLPVMENKLAHNERLQVDLVEAKNRINSQFHIASDSQP
jgi:hypothetical protein